MFVDNKHAADGSVQHRRVDKEGKSAPEPGGEYEELVVVGSITSSSERCRVIAKLDLAEFDSGRATSIDYKARGPDDVG